MADKMTTPTPDNRPIQDRLLSGYVKAEPVVLDDGSMHDQRCLDAANVIDGLVEANKNLAMLLGCFTGPDDEVANAIFEISDTALAATQGEVKS